MLPMVLCTSTHVIAGAIASIHMRTSEIIQIVACDKYDSFQRLKLHIFMKTCFRRLFHDEIHLSVQKYDIRLWWMDQ